MNVDVGSVLQVLGSLASLAAIPISLYIYFRSREAKYFKLTGEIVKALSFQIGEGRKISLFEMESVIRSKSRSHGLRPTVIRAADMVEDLVADTIANPMLDKNRKNEIVADLRTLRGDTEIFALVQDDAVFRSKLEKLALEATSSRKSGVRESIRWLIRSNGYAGARRSFSGLYGVAVFLMGFLLAWVGRLMGFTVADLFIVDSFFSKIVLGALASFLAVLIALAFAKYSPRPLPEVPGLQESGVTEDPQDS